MTATPQSVLDFWFGVPGSEEFGSKRKVWFTKSDNFDGLIRAQFEPTIQAAIAGQLDDWRHNDAEPEVTLAFILLLDQFTRNIYRNTDQMIAGDAGALAAAQSLVATGRDQQLSTLQRVFAYLPFEHSEQMPMQEESVRLFTALAQDPSAADYLSYAHKHYDVIARFGRFPHRNEWLGRRSTAEEAAYLKEPGSGF